MASWLSSLIKGKSPIPPTEWLDSLTVDAGKRACGNSLLGLPPSSPLAESLDAKGICGDETRGFYAEIKDGVLDCFTIDVTKFNGRIVFNDRAMSDQRSVSETDIRSLLGSPYWRDEDDDEIILFYESNGFETQVEFSGKGSMNFLVMTRQPLLADEVQRKAYGVTKPWPP